MCSKTLLLNSNNSYKKTKPYQKGETMKFVLVEVIGIKAMKENGKAQLHYLNLFLFKLSRYFLWTLFRRAIQFDLKEP